MKRSTIISLISFVVLSFTFAIVSASAQVVKPIPMGDQPATPSATPQTERIPVQPIQWGPTGRSTGGSTTRVNKTYKVYKMNGVDRNARAGVRDLQGRTTNVENGLTTKADKADVDKLVNRVGSIEDTVTNHGTRLDANDRQIAALFSDINYTVVALVLIPLLLLAFIILYPRFRDANATNANTTANATARADALAVRSPVNPVFPFDGHQVNIIDSFNTVSANRYDYLSSIHYAGDRDNNRQSPRRDQRSTSANQPANQPSA